MARGGKKIVEKFKREEETIPRMVMWKRKRVKAAKKVKRGRHRRYEVENRSCPELMNDQHHCCN
jgi:hypothetical protein